MIAASVLLVSVVQFYKQDTLVQEELPEVNNDTFFVTTRGALVYRWKLWGAVYAGAIGVGLSLLILVAHFDTFCVPRLWMHVFRDGSVIERNLIIVLLLFWAAALHVCTSSLSIGEVRPNENDASSLERRYFCLSYEFHVALQQVGNVYFTTWIGTYSGSIGLAFFSVPHWIRSTPSSHLCSSFRFHRTKLWRMARIGWPSVFIRGSQSLL